MPPRWEGIPGFHSEPRDFFCPFSEVPDPAPDNRYVKRIPIDVDTCFRLPPETPKAVRQALKREFTHANPDFHKRRARGHVTYSVPSKLKTFEELPNGELLIPRGGAAKLKLHLDANGFVPVFRDRTVKVPVEFPRFCVNPSRPEWALRPYQAEALRACLQRHQGIVRAPTGSGKTVIGLALIHEAGQRAMIIVRDKNLLQQWKREAVDCLGLRESDIGQIGGGRKARVGNHLTIALQQSLYRKGSDLAGHLAEKPIGLVLVDEVQTAAARTFIDVVHKIPAHWRIGLSADERRKDKKEFLTYDEFGSVLYEIDRETLEQKGYVLPVVVRMVPTDFEMPEYEDTRDWHALMEAMSACPGRNQVLRRVIAMIRDSGETPSVIFSQRREDAANIADMIYNDFRMPCGLMLGGTGRDATLYEEARDRIVSGSLQFAVGTFNALGVGINMPAIMSSVCALPLGNNKQYFGQVRGRTCRTSDGKTQAFLYYLWDRRIFPRAPRRIAKWNSGRVEILKGDDWVHVSEWRD